LHSSDGPVRVLVRTRLSGRGQQRPIQNGATELMPVLGRPSQDAFGCRGSFRSDPRSAGGFGLGSVKPAVQRGAGLVQAAPVLDRHAHAPRGGVVTAPIPALLGAMLRLFYAMRRGSLARARPQVRTGVAVALAGMIKRLICGVFLVVPICRIQAGTA
jgi:hypothetical protein